MTGTTSAVTPPPLRPGVAVAWLLALAWAVLILASQSSRAVVVPIPGVAGPSSPLVTLASFALGSETQDAWRGVHVLAAFAAAAYAAAVLSLRDGVHVLAAVVWTTLLLGVDAVWLHHDVVAGTFVLVAWLAHRRARFAESAFFLALGGSVELAALAVLPPFFLATRGAGRGSFIRGAAVGAWLGLLLPLGFVGKAVLGGEATAGPASAPMTPVAWAMTLAAVVGAPVFFEKRGARARDLAPLVVAELAWLAGASAGSAPSTLCRLLPLALVMSAERILFSEGRQPAAFRIATLVQGIGFLTRWISLHEAELSAEGVRSVAFVSARNVALIVLAALSLRALAPKRADEDDVATPEVEPLREILARGVRAVGASPTGRVAVGLVSLKLLVMLLVAATPWLLPGLFDTGAYKANFHWMLGPPPAAARFETWDAQEYLYLSHFGYRANHMADACYPLWPYAIRIFSVATLGDHLVSALLLANLFSLAAFLILHAEVRAAEGASVADKTIALLLAYPGALFFQLAYTEAPWFLFAVGFFAFLRRGILPAAALCGALLVLTRAVGIFILLPFGVHLVLARRKRELGWLLVPLASYGLLFAIMYVTTGNPFSNFTAQRYYIHQPSVGKIFDLRAFPKMIVAVTCLHGFLGSAIDRVWFLWYLLAIVPTFRRDKTWFAFLIPIGFVPAASASFAMYTRYLVVDFPIFVAAARLFERERFRFLLGPFLALLGTLHVVFLLRHVNNMWAG